MLGVPDRPHRSLDMPQLVKPRRLVAGDTIAAVTPSWGGPGTFPQRYAAGKAQIEQRFGLNVVEMAHTLAPAEWIARNPQARASDLMDAFTDPAISGIFATIGGDDCIRLLPYLDLDVIRSNPKVFLGFSDTTALHLACYAAGLTSFYGPSIMAGFAENGGMHAYTADGVHQAMFAAAPIGAVPINTEGWTAGPTDWASSSLQAQPRHLQPADAPRILQGSGTATGHLLGGCAEVLEMTKGTAWWPDKAAWQGAILFFETSEDAPSPISSAIGCATTLLRALLVAWPDCSSRVPILRAAAVISRPWRPPYCRSWRKPGAAISPCWPGSISATPSQCSPCPMA